MSVPSMPHFHDEEAAFSHFETVRWPHGPTCPHCGSHERIYKIKANPHKRVRFGLRKCRDCGKQFTAKVGTVFERAHTPLHKILQAVHLIACSKKGIRVHQLRLILEVRHETAALLARRIREVIRDGVPAPRGGDGAVEVGLSAKLPAPSAKVRDHSADASQEQFNRALRDIGMAPPAPVRKPRLSKGGAGQQANAARDRAPGRS